MPMTFDNAQVRITREIREAEEALDHALLSQTQLMASVLVARRDIGTSAFQGQDALMRLTRSQQSLITAGTDLARVHDRLLTLGAEVGALTDLVCPPKNQIESQLAEVA